MIHKHTSLIHRNFSQICGFIGIPVRFTRIQVLSPRVRVEFTRIPVTIHNDFSQIRMDTNLTLKDSSRIDKNICRIHKFPVGFTTIPVRFAKTISRIHKDSSLILKNFMDSHDHIRIYKDTHRTRKFPVGFTTIPHKFASIPVSFASISVEFITIPLRFTRIPVLISSLSAGCTRISVELANFILKNSIRIHKVFRIRKFPVGFTTNSTQIRKDSSRIHKAISWIRKFTIGITKCTHIFARIPVRFTKMSVGFSNFQSILQHKDSVMSPKLKRFFILPYDSGTL